MTNQNPFQSGAWSAIVQGPPGTGKSYAASTIAKFIDPSRCRALITKPREATSAGYIERGIPTEIFSDVLTWKPESGKYAVSGWKNLFKRVEELQLDNDVHGIVIDPGTDAAELLRHDILSFHKVASSGELANTQSYYALVANRMKTFIEGLSAAATTVVEVPKVVIVTWHTQPPKEEAVLSRGQGGGTKASADQRGRGIEYEGVALPKLEGGYRRDICGEFDFSLFTHLNKKNTSQGTKVEYQLQTSPHKGFHAKCAPLLDGDVDTYIPNDLSILHKAWLERKGK